VTATGPTLAAFLAPIGMISRARNPRRDLGDLTPHQFIDLFCQHMRCQPATEITRVWCCYLDQPTQDTTR
jgi:hypothetical protein